MSNNDSIVQDGVLVLHKQSGCTSHDMVNMIRKIYKTRQVGHTGTLDPLATGVLPILIGRATKASEYLVCNSKKYRALMRLGITTDTEDITGNILTKTSDIPCSNDVIRACTSFVGTVMQIPPMYSAIKINGKKLVDLARAGETIERKERQIEIFSIQCTPTDNARDYIIEVHCSAGTYIRTLCADIGRALGCGAVMAELVRTESGNFKLDDALTIEHVADFSDEERASVLKPIETLFLSLREVKLHPFYEKLFRNGCEIYQNKIKTFFNPEELLRVYDSTGAFFALGKVLEYPQGSAIKSQKLFFI